MRELNDLTTTKPVKTSLKTDIGLFVIGDYSSYVGADKRGPRLSEIGIYARCAADDKAINGCCAVTLLYSPYCRAYNRDRKASWEGCDVVFHSL